MTPHSKQALQYIVNTAGNATYANFLEDHDPIGEILWNRLVAQNWVYIDDDNKIQLTIYGHDALKAEG